MNSINNFYSLTSLFGTKAYLYLNNFYYGKNNQVVRYQDDNRLFMESIYTHINNLITDPSLIIDNIYLGSAYNAYNKQLLEDFNIKSILNVTDDLPNLYTDCYNYKNINIRDTRDCFIGTYLDDAYNYINENNKVPILVHCYMGSSRSASIVIYYLMKKYGLNFNIAYSIVKSKRSLINPNINFVNELKEFDRITKVKDVRLLKDV